MTTPSDMLDEKGLEAAAEATFRYEHGRAHMVPTWAEETPYLKEYWRESARTTVEAYLSHTSPDNGLVADLIEAADGLENGPYTSIKTTRDLLRKAAAALRTKDEGWVLVPVQPTNAQWSGLARDIVMWMDMCSGGDKTPRNLFLHLECLGRDIPQWLRDEPEMKHLNHVPSKGTRAAIIYKAMLAALPTPPVSDDKEKTV